MTVADWWYVAACVYTHAVSDIADDDVLEQILEESTCNWCETWSRVLYEWQVNNCMLEARQK